MADDNKNPKEASNIFHSIMKASVKPKKQSLVEQLAENLSKDLSKSLINSKYEVSIQDDYIIVRIPISDDFLITKEYLTPVINDSMVKHKANRAAVKITNGNEVDILSWGF